MMHNSAVVHHPSWVIAGTGSWVNSADALTALMEAPTDAEIIERLRMADQEAMEMGRRVGPGNWANISAMALAR